MLTYFKVNGKLFSKYMDYWGYCNGYFDMSLGFMLSNAYNVPE